MENLRVCVTAGGSGLGLAIAEAFHGRGAGVHICDVSAEALAAALGSHAGMHGSVADLGEPADVETFISEALAWLGGIDVLVNAVHARGPRAAIETIDGAAWDETLRVNLSGVFHCLRLVVPLMKQQRRGCIINLALAGARTGLPLRAPLAAAKAGVLGLTLSLARELSPHQVRCNAILPGVIGASGAIGGALGRDLGVTTGAGEVAEMAVLLASDEARHVTGQAISVGAPLEWDD